MDKELNNAKWIWDHTPGSRNKYIIFMKKFTGTQHGMLHITADARYFCSVNGARVGVGPIRSYQSPWFFDSYDISSLLKGDNVLTVLCLDMGESNFQYLYGACGLLFALETETRRAVSDADVQVDSYEGYARHAQHMSLTMFYEEIFDAGHASAFTGNPVYAAVVDDALRARHPVLERRSIPLLEEENILPAAAIRQEKTDKPSFRMCYNLRTAIASPTVCATPFITNLMVVAVIQAAEAHTTKLVYQNGLYDTWLNGIRVANETFTFVQGRNHMQIVYDGDIRFFYETALVLDSQLLALEKLFLVGPFSLTKEQKARAYGFGYVELLDGEDEPRKDPIYRAALEGRLEEAGKHCRDISSLAIHQSVMLDFMASSLSAIPEEPVVPVMPAVLHDRERILLDFGKEYTGRMGLSLSAPASAQLDFMFFEFIQPDGRVNLPEGMCNTMRYIAREGSQRYESLYPRGFRYCYVTARCDSPVSLQEVYVRFTHYPFSHRGRFHCADTLLNQIYEAAVQTTKCCMLDTYVDCPTYEQVLWVGDARIQALCDYAVNGDSRLWLRCLRLIAQSLSYSPVIQSQVPSGWYNIIPAWMCLWMISLYEYYMETGDREGILSLIPALRQNIEGVQAHINTLGLFEIRAWNMFDWADMDTPEDGIVTHQNCMLHGALHKASDLASLLDMPKLAREWDTLAQNLKQAINRHMWDEGQSAYTDCLRYRDGVWKQSPVFSQQTQTAAYLTESCTQEREPICKKEILQPREGFVRSGSPFFEFFKIESLMRDDDGQGFISTIRNSWGFMLEMGATTFWEMWSGKLTQGKRLTRSHCHGWSAAPLHFFKSFLLGVTPLEPGYKSIRVKPNLCGLSFVEGVVPTPLGDIHVHVRSDEHGEHVTVEKPETILIRQ